MVWRKRIFTQGTPDKDAATESLPAIDLVVGYNKANASPILKLFLSRMDD